MPRNLYASVQHVGEVALNRPGGLQRPPEIMNRNRHDGQGDHADQRSEVLTTGAEG